ncbi:putative bifunctional diguanylate cyclase/phosphodiesterase [Nitrosococcus halophilus]|nr:EAL domain-containing protein [Nitrosococcus halophilus]
MLHKLRHAHLSPLPPWPSAGGLALLALFIILFWFLTFPLKQGFDLNNIILETVVLVVALVAHAFILRLGITLLTGGWGLLLGSLLLGLLGEFTQESRQWSTLVERILEILGLALIAFGFYRSQRLLQTQLKKTQAKETRSRHLAQYDALTGLPNRILLQDRLAQSMAETLHSRQQLALLFLDLDRFKDINDSFGHEIGDAELIRVAGVLHGCVGPTDTVLRIGGDEFAIIQTHILDADEAALLAQRILGAIAEPHRLQGHKIHNNVSIGITLFPSDAPTAKQLLKNADIALYHAKHEGRNNYQLYMPDINARAHSRVALAKDLQSALESGDLHLQFQPQLDLTSGRTVSFEALLRWRHPQHGMLARQTFIRLAEETGLIIPIGAWVLEIACQTCFSWQQFHSGPLQVAVNLSPRQFRQPDLAGGIAAILERTGLSPPSLEVEITEGLLIEDMDSALKTLQSLSTLGVRISVDDFGTGHSSLTYLKHLPLDSIKIDRSFIHDIPEEIESRAITKAIIALGHSLNLEVVAEGVETQEQFLYLQEYGCDRVQGYFISKPLNAPRAQKWWQEKG